MNRKFVSFLAVAIFSAVSASAAPIIVNNHSFETLPPGGLPFGCGAGCFFSESTGIPGWTDSIPTGANGEFRPGTDVSNFAYFSTLSSDGTPTILYSDDPGTIISQTVAPTVLLGVTYTLMVDLGTRHDYPFNASADLLINGTSHLALGTPAPPGSGSWSTFTAVYVGLATDVGDPITIELRNLGVANGAQADFDNVRLSDSTTTTAVPEPGSLLLVGSGLLVGVRRWRKRR
jgi:hypothetical protein